MTEPDFDDVFDEEVNIDEQADARVVNWVAGLRGASAYWKGRCEGHEATIAQMRESHTLALNQILANHNDAIDRLNDAHETTLSYLKDRLNRLEVKGADHD